MAKWTWKSASTESRARNRDRAVGSVWRAGQASSKTEGRSFGPGPTGIATLLAVSALACGDVDGPVLVTAEDSALPATLREAYREDAARLALREILQEDGPEADRVEISPERSDYFYSALVRVFNFRHHARDDVVDRYGIHTFPSPSVNTLSLRVGGAAWADAWRRGERLTGNPGVDRLVQDYGLRVYDYYSSPTLGDLFTLTSDLNLNARALGKRFEGIEGVQSAYSDGACCDGNDIEAARTGIGVVLEFSAGYGDCPSGCIYRHFWSFLVWNDGRVEFAGERGNPAPPIALGQ